MSVFLPPDLEESMVKIYRRNFVLLILILLVSGLPSTARAQETSKTIILVRHAEKDTSAAADPDDPDLTAEGKQRAERLWKVIKRYKPGALYSTDYRRTRGTLAEVARRRHLDVKTYDARKPADLAAAIAASPVRRVVVVGHSNTVPGLANLLLKKELFKQLDDSEYGAIWVIKLRKGKPPRAEILSY